MLVSSTEPVLDINQHRNDRIYLLHT